MKLRQGFVSNSSTSSFVIKLNKEIKEYSFTEFAQEYEIPTDDLQYGLKLYHDILKQYAEIDTNKVVDFTNSIFVNYSFDEDQKKELLQKINDYALNLLSNYEKQYKYTVEYCSHDGVDEAYMKEKFMPNFKGTIEEIEE